MVTQNTYTLLGIALYRTQKLELILYGLAAHYSHIPAVQKEKRFRELDPETFLRGDLSGLKSTPGQICKAFGANFHIDGPFLDFSHHLPRHLLPRSQRHQLRFRQQQLIWNAPVLLHQRHLLTVAR